MIICNAKCSIFDRCKDKIPQQVCIYDLGLPEEKDEDMGDIIEKITYQENNSFKIITLMDKNAHDFFNQKMRICLLGEPSIISQSKVIEMCRKFFQYGLEYGKQK